MDDSIEKGKLFNFVKPSKIYLGKNISKNEVFEKEILVVSKELGIPVMRK